MLELAVTPAPETFADFRAQGGTIADRASHLSVPERVLVDRADFAARPKPVGEGALLEPGGWRSGGQETAWHRSG
jgi:hypothetical protein